jgi:hypothetical protein
MFATMDLIAGKARRAFTWSCQSPGHSGDAIPGRGSMREVFVATAFGLRDFFGAYRIGLAGCRHLFSGAGSRLPTAAFELISDLARPGRRCS